jgi:glycosyltransferase involved in cell wall biosynthesis
VQLKKQSAIPLFPTDGKASERPLVSVVLIAFQQECFIRDAVHSLLAQDYSPLQIVLSDDCSSDRTFDIITEIARNYSGPHLLVLNRNPVNFGAHGIGLHVNRAIALANGELIVFAAGDDVSVPHRVSRLVKTWLEAGSPQGSIHSAVEIISPKGTRSADVVHGKTDFGNQTIIQCIETGAAGVLGASHAITRGVYEKFGPLPQGVLFEDRAFAFRSLLIGKILYCHEPLVQYRQHEANLSGKEKFTNEGRWLRWVEGISVKLATFRSDYELITAAKHRDPRVLAAIEKEIIRAARARDLVSGTRLQRAVAAFYYSARFDFSDRVAFVLQRGGFNDGFAYRTLARVWRIWRRGFTSK